MSFAKSVRRYASFQGLAAILFVLTCAAGAMSTELAHAADSMSARPAAQPAFVAARQVSFSPRLTAYGQVEPTSIVRIRAVDAGTISHLDLLPGSVVTAGEVVARIGGTRMQSLLTSRTAAVQSASARLDAARKALVIARRQLAAQLGTRQQVDAAASELEAAHAALLTAQAQLGEAREFQALVTPIAGTVLDVHAANGEQASSGQTILTVTPQGHLWVRADYYGAAGASIHPGMTGRFIPEGGGQSVAVKVATVGAGAESDGARRIGLMSVGQAAWIAGQWGTVVLDAARRPMVAIPTTALILDRSAWWVLVHTAHGDQPRKVVPGPALGWETLITSGLQPGDQVVTQNAFLEFHRGIAASYTPPN